LLKIFGPSHEKDKYQGNDVAGVVTGLAWTPTGGDILFIETSLTKERQAHLTGNLGDVMKESAVLALEYLKAHSEHLGIEQEVFDKWNVHIHVPQGAIPKDGPSAGITIFNGPRLCFFTEEGQEILGHDRRDYTSRKCSTCWRHKGENIGRETSGDKGDYSF